MRDKTSGKERKGNMKGLVHIYTGDGKGKTTAAIGLGVRACGRGMKVLMVQFLKSDPLGRDVQPGNAGAELRAPGGDRIGRSSPGRWTGMKKTGLPQDSRNSSTAPPMQHGTANATS